MEEIKAAGIEDLVQCPFCNYATIMPPDVKIVACLNPECQKESCRCVRTSGGITRGGGAIAGSSDYASASLIIDN